MKPEHEIMLAKIITLVIIILTLLEFKAYGFSRENIADAFITRNRKITPEQACYYANIIHLAGAEYHVSQKLITAVIICESNADSRAVSRTRDYGLMQIHYSAHKDKIARLDDLYDPHVNIFLGTRILSQYMASTRNLAQALTRYSGGSRKYAQKVIRTLRSLEK